MRIILFTISFILATSAYAQELMSSTVVERQNSIIINIGLLSLGADVRAEYDVELVNITYTTTGTKGESDIASGLLLIPIVDKAVPLHCHLHGTSTRDRVPTTKGGGYELGLIYASLGQMVVMPDFLGMGSSNGFHPYVHRTTQASASLDMLIAAKEYVESRDDVTLTDELIIAGYSQGGHAAMSLQQEVEANYSDVFNLIASTPMSGPYNLSGVFKDFILNGEEYLFPGYLLYQLLGYNEVDSSLFTNIADILKEPYQSAAMTFASTGTELGMLHDFLNNELNMLEGGYFPIKMLKNDYVDEFIADDNHPFNVALRENDTHNFVAKTPTRLIYCKADDQVPYKNSLVADSIMNALGATNVTSIDVLSTADHGGCIVPAVEESIRFINQFLQSTSTVDLTKSLSGISVYPNPVDSELSIKNEYDDVAIKAIYIYDSSARLIYRSNWAGERSVDVSSWSSGIYAMQVITTDGPLWRRIVKK